VKACLRALLDARQAPVDRHTVAAAVEGAYACLEVVHSTWTGYRFNLEQNTADNASAGHPLDAEARLARELAANDQRLEAGDLVITGGLTAAWALEVGGGRSVWL
jgi:hypothetical protein